MDGRLRPIARKIIHGARRARGYASLRRLDSSTPLSRASGYDRGTPVDRYYIERFLAENASDIRGRVLETGGDSYSRRFGGDRITRQDILQIDAGNPEATIVGDLSAPGTLPPSTFDCIILTQVLQYVFDLPAAMKQIAGALRPGGVALVTVPGVAPVCLDEWRDSFYWRFTAASVERLAGVAFDPAAVKVTPYGNLYAATAFLQGAAVEELDRKKLEPLMPEYAIVIAARAVA